MKFIQKGDSDGELSVILLWEEMRTLFFFTSVSIKILPVGEISILTERRTPTRVDSREM